MFSQDGKYNKITKYKCKCSSDFQGYRQYKCFLHKGYDKDVDKATTTISHLFSSKTKHTS